MTFNLKPIATQLLTLGALALAASAALAAPGVPAGELIDAPFTATEARSTRSRAEMTNEVITARQAGTLAAAGEAPGAGVATLAAAPQRSRAEVKAEVLAARAAGTLLAAGEIERTNGAWPARLTPRIDMARSSQAGSMK